MIISNRIIISILLILSFLLSGCTTMMQQLTDQGTRRGVSSSLVDFLYPTGEALREGLNQTKVLRLNMNWGLLEKVMP